MRHVKRIQLGKWRLESQKQREALINFETKGKGCATLGNILKQNRRRQKAPVHEPQE